MTAKPKAPGRVIFDETANLATPDTLLARYRQLIARKWTFPREGPGRPPISEQIAELVQRMTHDNPSWGYDRLQGALVNLGPTVSSNTVANILRHHGIEPAPERGKRTSWPTFVKAHSDVVAATDFVTVDECLDCTSLLGERSRRRTLREYSTRCLRERNHRGIRNPLLGPSNVVATSTGAIQRGERLGQMLSFYLREAA